MKSDIDMNLHQIKRIKLPSAADDAATKGYVDSHSVNSSNFLKVDGSSKMNDDLDMDLNEIINLQYPSFPHSAASKKYVDDNAYLPPSDLVKQTNASFKSDVQMNNFKIVGCGIATNDLDLVNKVYVDTNLQQNLNVSLQNLRRNLQHVLPLDGSKAMVGTLNMFNNRISNLKLPVESADAASKAYVDSHSHSSSQNVSFEEHMSEFLTYNGNPFYLAKQAVKQSDYVLFKQDKNLVHTNSVNLFNLLTDAELVFRKNGLWDIMLFLNIRTIQKTMLMCEVWSQNDSGKFIQKQTIQYILNNSNNVAKLIFFKFTTTIQADEFFKVYIKDNGNTFEGGKSSFVFIQENRMNSKFKKLEVEEAQNKRFNCKWKCCFTKNRCIKCYTS